MQKINLTPDKFGFYKVGDKSTYSKLEAIEWSKKDNKNFLVKNRLLDLIFFFRRNVPWVVLAREHGIFPYKSIYST